MLSVVSRYSRLGEVIFCPALGTAPPASPPTSCKRGSLGFACPPSTSNEKMQFPPVDVIIPVRHNNVYPVPITRVWWGLGLQGGWNSKALHRAQTRSQPWLRLPSKGPAFKWPVSAFLPNKSNLSPISPVFVQTRILQSHQTNALLIIIFKLAIFKIAIVIKT